MRSLRLAGSALIVVLAASACSASAGVESLDAVAPSDTEAPVEASSTDAVDETDQPESTESDNGAAPDDQSAEPSASPPAPVADAFVGITLAASTVEELDRVMLSGLPEGFDASQVAMMIVAGDYEVPVEVQSNDEGSFFTAPLNPDGPGTDGATEVFLTDGVNDGPRLALALTGLPPAPGAGAEFAQFMWDLVDAQAQERGSSFAALAATSFEDTPPELGRLKLLQGLIDDGSTNDLMSAFSAEESGLAADDMALVDAIIAKVEPQASVKVPPPPPPPGTSPPPPSSSRPAGDQGPLPTTTLDVTAGASECNSSDIPAINSAADLVEALAIGVAAKANLNGATGKVLTDFKNMLAHGTAIPKIGTIVGVLGAGYNTVFLAEAADGGRYPSALSGLSVEVTPQVFNEDFEMEGNWSNVRVSATSTGYNATADLIGLVVDGVSIGGGVVKTRNADLGDQIGGVVDPAGKVVNTATGEFLASDAGPAFANFCPHTWTVDLPGSTYTKVRSTLKTLEIDADARTFKPTKVNRDALVVETDPGAFAGFTVSATTDIETKMTAVQLEPNDIEVQKAGDVVSISVGFVNSDSESVRWQTTAGEFVDGLGDVTEGEVTRELKTPGNSDLFDVEVTATLETKQGLFADEDRTLPSDFTLLRLADLIVDPDGATVTPGNTVQYTATTPDGDPVEVSWSAGGGSIDDEGLYTAGDEPGTYEVTATSIADPNVSATVTVTIVDTSCVVGRWSVRLDEMAEQISALTPEGAFLFLSGEYIITMFDDSTWQAERRELVFEMMAQGQTAQMNITSAEFGTYSADGATLSIAETSSDAVATITVPGIGTLGGEVPPGGSFNGSGAYTCERPVLTVSADGFVSTLDYLGPPG